MRRPITKSLIVAALLSSGAAYAGAPGWQVSEISGNVTIARKGVVKIAQRQTKLAPGDVIKTGPKGRAVLLRGGEYLVVSPASHIEIAEPKKSGKITQIIEYFGNVLFRIDKKETPHFGVKTPYMAAVVKGTTFSVSVSAEGSAVQVTEGAVEVSTLDDGASELVTPGVIGMINANDPFSLVVLDGERRVIESPNKPNTTGNENVTTTSAQSSASSNVASITLPSSNLSGAVSVPIGEEGVELAELTNGLIRGDVDYNRFVIVENAEESIGVLAADVLEDTNDDISDEESDTSDDHDVGDVEQNENTDQSNDDQVNDNLEDDNQGYTGEDDEGQGDDGQDTGDESEGDLNDSDQGQGEDDQNDDDQGNDDDRDDDDRDDDDRDDDDRDDDDRDDDDLDDDDRDDDGNNGHGNDDDGFDESNPGRGGGKGKGNDDGNNGHGNDPDGFDDSNPGRGNANGRRPR
ncbi:hypothetical protein GCM10009096_02500 [Parasphingorhabdus litoris]|uniref:FecR protein domain-containing protein n=1 Tax=Parasphingorhabdus litoris TaxID=394733 RepID=A0ABN1A1S8_9SPHN|nr:FecR family protein [Parasphingorhabdus litoris]